MKVSPHLLSIIWFNSISKTNEVLLRHKTDIYQGSLESERECSLFEQI